MAKSQILEYTIHLRDRAVAEQLAADLASLTPTSRTGQVIVYPGGGKIGIYRAPYAPGPPEGGAAVEFSLADGTYPPALTIVEKGGAPPLTGPGYITSEWFTSGSDSFPRDVQTFQRSTGWWIFGSNTRFYWAGQVVWSPIPESNPPADVVEVTEPAPIPQRRALSSMELSYASGDTIMGVLSAGAAMPISRGGSRRSIEGKGGHVVQSGAGTQYNSYNLGTATRGHWERLYFSIEETPSAECGLWRGFVASTANVGLGFTITPALQIGFYQFAPAQLIIGTFLTLTQRRTYRADILFDVDATPDVITCSLWIDGVFVCTGSRAAGGILGLRTHSESRIGKWDGNTTAAVIAFSDWIVSLPPKTRDAAVAAYNPVTAYVVGDFVRIGSATEGIRYRALQNSTGVTPGPANQAFWRRLTDPIDWVNGSKLVRLKPTGFASSHNAAAWPGDFKLLLQHGIEANQGDSLLSSTSGAICAVTTDMARQVDALPGAIGWVAMNVQAYSLRGGAPSGTLGYKIGAAAAVDIAATQNNILDWQTGVMYAPAGLTAPIPPGTAVELRHTKAADGTNGRIAAISAYVEVIGKFGPEDITPNLDDPAADVDDQLLALPPAQVGGVHNAYVPDSPWATNRETFGPIVIVGGTYVGTGITSGIELLFKAPPCLLIIRPPTAIDGGGELWWPSLVRGHTAHNEGYGLATGILDVDQDLTFNQANPDADQQMQFRVRIGGANNQFNAVGQTYQYIAFCDPAGRYMRSGIGMGTANNGTSVKPLDDDGFTPQFALICREAVGNSTINGVYVKSAGHAADACSLADGGTIITPALTFGTGQVTFGTALWTAVAAQYPFLLFRRNDGNAHPDEGKVMFFGTYTGDGAASKTITLPSATGLRPMYACVMAHSSSACRHRDPSHTGVTSSNPGTGAQDATQGITAGGIDQFTVGTSLNANGVVYSYFGFYGSATAGNGGWSINTELVPVPSDSPRPSDWSEPVPMDVPTTPDVTLVDEPDLEDDTVIGSSTFNVGGLLGGRTCQEYTRAIVNRALHHIGISKRIVNLATDASEEAYQSRDHIKEDINAVLREFDWPFATRYQELVLVGGTETDPVNADWQYSYRGPNAMMKARRIVGQAQERRDYDPDPPKFRLGMDDSGPLIFTNEVATSDVPLVLEYTVRHLCPAFYGDALFREAVAWKHASSLAMALSRDSKKQEFCLAMYRALLPRASAPAANEQQQAPDGDAPWITDRN